VVEASKRKCTSQQRGEPEYANMRESVRESNKEKGLPEKDITLVKKMGDFVAVAIC
jgi:hypothetical protein